MLTKEHLIASTPILLLYPWLGSDIFLIIASSLIIDVDHIQLIIKKKAFSVEKLFLLKDEFYTEYRDNPRDAFKDILYLFHTVEFNIVLLILACLYPPLWLVFFGFVFHVISDVIHHAATGMPILRWLLIFEFVRVNQEDESSKLLNANKEGDFLRQ